MTKKHLKLYIYNALINFSLVGVILNLYLSYVGLSYSQIGILAATLQLGKCVLEIPTGYIADRFGNKISVTISLLLNIVAYIAMITSTEFFSLLICFVILAISYTLSTGCVDAIVVNSALEAGNDEELIRVSSINRIIQYTACGSSSIVACLVAENSYRLAFEIDILVLILCLFLIFNFEDKNSKEQSNRNADYSIKTISKYILSNGSLFYFILVESAVAWAMVPVDHFYANYLTEIFEIPISLIGIIIAAQFAIVSFVGLLSKRLNDQIGENRVIRVGPFVMLLFFTLFAFTPSPLLAVAFYFLGLSVFCLYSPICYRSMQKGIKSEYRVTVISFKSLAIAGISSISSPLMGALSDKYGMNIGMRMLLVISILFLVVINTHYRKLDFQKLQV